MSSVKEILRGTFSRTPRGLASVRSSASFDSSGSSSSLNSGARVRLRPLFAGVTHGRLASRSRGQVARAGTNGVVSGTNRDANQPALQCRREPERGDRQADPVQNTTPWWRTAKPRQAVQFKRSASPANHQSPRTQNASDKAHGPPHLVLGTSARYRPRD